MMNSIWNAFIQALKSAHHMHVDHALYKAWEASERQKAVRHTTLNSENDQNT